MPLSILRKSFSIRSLPHSQALFLASSSSQIFKRKVSVFGSIGVFNSTLQESCRSIDLSLNVWKPFNKQKLISSLQKILNESKKACLVYMFSRALGICHTEKESKWSSQIFFTIDFRLITNGAKTVSMNINLVYQKSHYTISCS